MDSVFLLGASRLFLVLTILVAPWCIGGKYPSTQQFLFAGVAVSSLLLFFAVVTSKENKGRFNRHIPLLILPLTLGLVYATIQYLPLGFTAFDQREFGYDTETWKSLLSFQESTPPFNIVSVSTNEVSVCSSETRLISFHLTVAIAAFVLGAALFVRTESVLWLWIAVLINGALLAIFGVVQKVVGSAEAFWIYDLFENVQITGDAQPFASFLNRNNASGYLNMVAACGIGFWLSAHAKGEKDRTIQLMLTQKDRTTAIAEFIGHFRQFLSELRGLKLLAVILTTIAFAGIVASASRGGIGALCVGIVVLYVALAKRRQWTAANSIAIVPILGVAFILAYAGLTQNVGDRLDTLTWDNFKESGRWTNWQDASHAWRNHALWGTGLGTYRFVYLPFQSYLDNHIYYYAENQYLQTAIEMGIPGLLLMLCIMVMTCFTLNWFLFAKKRPEFDPIAYCGLFVFVTQAVQALVDFGLYRTGNMLLCAVLLGSLFGRQAFLRRGKKEASEKKRSGNSGLATVTLLCIVGSILATYELHQKAPLQSRDVGKTILDSPESLSRNELDQHIQELDAGLKRRPDDPEAGLLLARLLIYRYRLDYYDEFVEQSASPSDAAKAIAWNSSGMLYFHDQTRALRETNNNAAREQLLEVQSVRENLVAAYLYLKRADQACPVMPRVKLLLAQLGPLMGDSKSQVQEWIRQSANLNAVDPQLLYVAGYLAFQEQMNDECAGYWKQALSLDDEKKKDTSLVLANKYLLSIYQTARLRWPPEFVVKNIFPDKPSTLIQYARYDINRLQKKENTLQGISAEEVRFVVQLLAEKTLKILSKRDEYDLTADDYRLLAQAARIANRPEEAVDYFKKAVEAASIDVTIRYEFAQFLVEIEDYKEAEIHAKMCTQLNSREKKYRELEARILKLKINNTDDEKNEKQ